MSLDSLVPLPLDTNTPPAHALQQAVQSELGARNWAPADDADMAEYTVLMVANRKTGAQVAQELSDLVGPDDFRPEFVVWLWNAATAVLQGQPIPPGSTVPEPEPEPEPELEPEPEMIEAEPGYDYRSRSRSPGRSRSPAHDDEGRYGGGRAAQERSYRGRPVRPQKGLFDAAIHDATSQPRRRPPMGRARDDGMSHVLELDNENDQHASQRTAVRGQRDKGELFPHVVPGRDLSIRGRAGKKEDPENNLSIFARTSTPNPNLPAFVPRDQAQLDDMMETDVAPAEGTSLLSRLGPRAVPPSAPQPRTQLDINSVDVRQFPWEPTKDESCRFDLRCTQPLCPYSHATPVLANSPNAGNAMLLSTTHCPSGPKCLSKECTLSHPSPAVSVLASRAQAAARAQLARARLIAVRAGATPFGGQKAPCRFQASCTNTQCTFAHFDAQGAPVPPPAQEAQPQQVQQQQTTTQDSTTTGQPAPSSDGTQPMDVALDKPLDDAPAAKPCRFGTNCTRPGCFFSHPPGRVEPNWANKPKAWNKNSSATFDSAGSPQTRPPVACKFGVHCTRYGCFFSHPPERQEPPPPGTKPSTSERLAGFASERDPDDVERIIPSTS